MSRIKILVVLLLLLLAACSQTTPDPNPSDGEFATVTRVIDGDTIDVELNGEIVRVRYIGVNTPERDEVCFQDATDANANLVNGQRVRLVKDVSETDRFDRLLRYVYVGDTFVNAELVEQGFAESVRFPPDTRHAATFDRLEDEARRANIGCHPTGVFG